MLRFDTVLGDIPYLLLGIPLTLAITFTAFVAGTACGVTDRCRSLCPHPDPEPHNFFNRRVFSYDAPANAHCLDLLRASSISGYPYQCIFCRRRRACLQRCRTNERNLSRRHRGGAARSMGCRLRARPFLSATDLVGNPAAIAAADLRAGLQLARQPAETVLTCRRYCIAGGNELRLGACGAEFPTHRSADYRRANLFRLDLAARSFRVVSRETEWLCLSSRLAHRNCEAPTSQRLQPRGEVRCVS